MTILFKRTRDLIANLTGVTEHKAAMSAALIGQVETLMADGWLPKSLQHMLRPLRRHLS